MTAGTRLLYVARAERKRLALSTAGAVLMFCIIVGAGILLDLLMPAELGTSPGPVRIRLGRADAPDAVAAPVPEATEPAPPPTDTKVPAEPVPLTPPEPSPAPTIPVPTPKDSPSPPVEKPAPAVPSPAASSPAPNSVVRGSETGNSHETVFGAPGAEVGRNFYAPVVDYMPLPSLVPADVRKRLKAGQIPLVERFYKDDGSGNYKLAAKVDFGLRPQLWSSLIQAGYDPTRADYRSLNLAPVSIKFTVERSVGSETRVSGLRLTSSSGNPDIDEAVLYGFQSSSFFNNTQRDLQGTFTYRFD